MKLVLYVIASLILAVIGIFVGGTINYVAGTVILISSMILVFIGAIAGSKEKSSSRARKDSWQKKLQEKNQAQQEKVRQRVDNKVDTQVKHLYAQYGEEWINNAGRSRLTMAIDEILGPAPRGNSNAARAQRTLAAAVLETVLERKGETIRQQQAASREGAQAGIVVDPMLAADIMDTAGALAADADYTDDLEDADDVDDVDMDVDLDID